MTHGNLFQAATDRTTILFWREVIADPPKICTAIQLSDKALPEISAVRGWISYFGERSKDKASKSGVPRKSTRRVRPQTKDRFYFISVPY
jgi:hypothetical protein